jgi:hypothetical protein
LAWCIVVQGAPLVRRTLHLSQVSPDTGRPELVKGLATEREDLPSIYRYSASLSVSMPPPPRPPPTTLPPCPAPMQRRRPPWCVVGTLRHGGVEHPKPLKRRGVQVPTSNRRSPVAPARTRCAPVTSVAAARAAPSFGIALVRMRRLHATTSRCGREARVGLASRGRRPRRASWRVWACSAAGSAREQRRVRRRASSSGQHWPNSRATSLPWPAPVSTWVGRRRCPDAGRTVLGHP